MPNYEFQCEKCRRTFTLKRTFEEYDRTKQVKCPKCGAEEVRQMIGSVFTKTSKKS